MSKLCILIGCMCLCISYLHAHSGGLDASGCHAGSKPYHCHRQPNEMVGNRLRCDLGSKSIECNSTSRKESSTYSRQNNASDPVARALFEAAEREPDPEIKKELMNEYYRYIAR